MNAQGLNANIMSLGGIAIAIGAMVDAAIVMIETVHKKMEREDYDAGSHWSVVTEAAVEVGPPLFFSLLIITFSFLPVFTLQAQEGRMFAPLAFTKTYAMAAACRIGHHPGARVDGLFHPGKNPSGASEPDQPLPDLGLPAPDRAGHPAPLAGDDHGTDAGDHRFLAGQQAGL